MPNGVVVADPGRTLTETLAGLADPSPSAEPVLLVIQDSVALGGNSWAPVVVPRHVRLVIPTGGRISLGTGTLEVPTAILAGDWPIFGRMPARPGVFLASGVARAAWWGLDGSAGPSGAEANVRALASAMASVSRDGKPGVVRVATGDFYLDATVTVPDGIRVEGAGADVSQFVNVNSVVPGAEPATRPVFRCVGAGILSNFGLKDFGGAQATGIRLDGASRLADVSFAGFRRGVDAHLARTLVIERCRFAGCRSAVVLEGIGDVRLDDVEAVGPSSSPEGWTAVLIGSTTTPSGLVRVRKSRFAGSGGTGLAFLGARTATVTDCGFAGLTRGIVFGAGSLRVPGSHVGRCRFESCKSEVVSDGVAAYVRVDRAGGGIRRPDMAAGAPAGTEWRVGDQLRNTVPTIGEPFGWVCTKDGGGPGNWRGFGRFANVAATTSVTPATRPLALGIASSRAAGVGTPRLGATCAAAACSARVVANARLESAGTTRARQAANAHGNPLGRNEPIASIRIASRADYSGRVQAAPRASPGPTPVNSSTPASSVLKGNAWRPSFPRGLAFHDAYNALLRTSSGASSAIAMAIRYKGVPYPQLDADTRGLIWTRITDLELGTTGSWNQLKWLWTIDAAGIRQYLTEEEVRFLWAMRVAMALYVERHGYSRSRLASLRPEELELLLSCTETPYTATFIAPAIRPAIPPWSLKTYPANDPDSIATCKNGQGFFVWNDPRDRARPSKRHLGNIWDINPLVAFNLTQTVVSLAIDKINSLGKWYYLHPDPLSALNQFELVCFYLNITLRVRHGTPADVANLANRPKYPNGREGDPGGRTDVFGEGGMDLETVLAGYKDGTGERNVVLGGCGSCAQVLQALARSLNIPSFIVAMDPNPVSGEWGHAGIVFPSLGKVYFTCDNFYAPLETLMPLEYRLYDISLIPDALRGYDRPASLYLAERERYRTLFARDVPLLRDRLQAFPMGTPESRKLQSMTTLLCCGTQTPQGWSSIENSVLANILPSSALPEFSTVGCPGTATGRLNCDSEVLAALAEARRQLTCSPCSPAGST